MSERKQQKAQRQPFHEEFAEKIIKHLEAGTAPWQKPWHPGKTLAVPHNPVSGSVYRGMNRVSLALSGYDDPRWMTFRQANGQGLKIISGSKATPIVFYQFTEERDLVGENGKPILDGEGKPQKQTVELDRPLLRFAHVFNAEQIEGMPPLELTGKAFEWEPLEKAESILEASSAEIRHDQSDRAFYRYASDSIHLPPKDNFEDPGKYYGTALHELGHWTRHSIRLDRENGPFGSELYAREELRAEIASWMLGQDLGIPHDPAQHAAYVSSWIRALKEDPFEIIRACRDAEQIKEYIMGLEMKKELEQVQKAEINNEFGGITFQDEELKVLRSSGLPTFEEYRSGVLDFVEQSAEWFALDSYNFYTVSSYGFKESSDNAHGGLDCAMFFKNSHDSMTDERLLSAYQAEAQQVLNLWREELAAEQDIVAAKEKTFLAVPYKEKEQAKKLGAKWDKENKLWYVPEGENLAPFEKWRGEHERPAPKSALSPAHELAQAISEMGGDLRGELPVMDGKIHRIPCFNRHSGNKDFSYCAFNDEQPAGWVQNFASGEKVTWSYSAHELTEEEKIELRKRQAEHKEARQREQAREHDRIAVECAASFDERAPAHSEHGYLVKKGIEPVDGLKITPDGKRLIVPLANIDGEIRTLQYISENGFKGYEPGGEKKGNFFVMGCAATELRKQSKLLLAEGFSTAASLHQASGLPTVMAGDIYNMELVAGKIREMMPDAEIYICADNDHAHKLPDGKLYNIGVERAKDVAQKAKAQVIIPKLTQDEKEKGLKDFNDIHTSRGLNEVKNQIEIGLAQSKNKELAI